MLPGEEQYDKAYVLLETWCSAIRTIVTTAIGWPWSVPSWDCGSARATSAISLADSAQGKPYAPPEWLPLLHYRVAETYVLQRQPQAAVLLRALQMQELSPTLRAWVELRLGNVHDLQGERQAAQAWYQCRGMSRRKHAPTST